MPGVTSSIMSICFTRKIPNPDVYAKNLPGSHGEITHGKEVMEIPAGDRTGPMGAGPKTGRGLSYCSGHHQLGIARPARGFAGAYGGRRGSMGRGWRHRFYAIHIPGRAAFTPDQQTTDLKAQADWLTQQLDAAQKCLKELKPEK